MDDFEKALQKVRQRQMTHEDRGPGDQRVRDALKSMEEMVVPQSPAELAMMFAAGPIGGKAFKGASMVAGALASDDANAAFIGPKGIERLKKAGKDVKEMFSHVLHQPRAEVNPPIHSNVWWEMGNVSQQVQNALKNKNASPLLKELISPEEFPELAIAYPELFKMKVNLNPTKFDSPMKASFKPDLDETGDRARKLLDRLTERYERSNPFPKSKISVRPTEEEISLVDKWNVGFEKQLADKLGIAYEEGTPFFGYDLAQALEKYVRPKGSGEINFTFPETSFAMRPGRDFAESLLHESQHAIQNIEDGSRSGMMSMYRNADQDLKESILSSIDDLNDYNRQRWGRGNDYEPKQGSAVQSRIEKTNELKPNFDQERFMDWLEENSSNPRVSYVAKRSGLTRDAVENGYWTDENFIDILADLRDDGIDTNEFLRRAEKRNYDVDQSYLYKNNPYEREAFEASRRDVDPQYREMYRPKTLR